MKSLIISAALIGGLFTAGQLQAQTPAANEEKTEVGTEQSTQSSATTKSGEKVQKTYITKDQIILAKDINYKHGETDMSDHLARKYGMEEGETEELADTRTQLQKDLANIRVITPEAYAALPQGKKVEVDNDPLYFVTTKTQRQKMADYVIDNSRNMRAASPVKQDGGAKQEEVTPPANMGMFGEDF